MKMRCKYELNKCGEEFSGHDFDADTANIFINVSKDEKSHQILINEESKNNQRK